MVKSRPGCALSAKGAAALIAKAATARGIAFAKVTGKTVGFSDLARGSGVFVKVHGWGGGPVEARELDWPTTRRGRCPDG